MVVMGITGGVASGKSRVARELQRRGAWVLDADRVGHRVLRQASVKRALHRRWGDEVFDSAAGGLWGSVNRAAVARRVFAPPPAGPRELNFLESVTHPLIGARLARCLERAGRRGVPVVVLDAPVLYKAGWDRFCDLLLFVDAPQPVRTARAAQRGWSAEALAARQARQPDLQMQRERADVVLDNGGSWSATCQNLAALWDNLPRGTKKMGGLAEFWANRPSRGDRKSDNEGDG